MNKYTSYLRLFNTRNTLKTVKYNSLLLTFIFAVELFSCQQEIEDIVTPSTEDSFLKGSVLFEHIDAVGLKDGSDDNIIDQCSCLSLVYPVTVSANGNVILLESNEGLIQVERVFDNYETADTLQISYPIKVSLANHEIIEVSDNNELQTLKESCIEGGLDKDIECVDLVYPISISIYDTEFQRSRSKVLNSDMELSVFLNNLNATEYISIGFPIQLITKDNSIIPITSNIELETALNDLGSSCDEDDDNDYNDDDLDVLPIFQLLLSQNYVITYYYEEADLTSNYSNYIFNYENNDSIYISNGILDISGEWKVFGDDGTLDLKLNGDFDLPLKDLKNEWDIVEYNDSVIQLTERISSNTYKNLTFKKTSKLAKSINQVLLSSLWQISLLTLNGADETSNFIGYNFSFYANDISTAKNGTTITDGNWSAFEDKGLNIIQLDFTSNAPYDLIRENWEIVEYSDTFIYLQLTDSEGLIIGILKLNVI